jgi:hypothetical protein
MPLTDDKLPPRPKFPVLDDGTYQVVIKDINNYEGRNFNTNEPETQYQFDLEVLEGENKGHVMKVWTSTKYAAAKSGRQESKLYTIVVKTMGKAIQADELHLTPLIGKQMKVVVTKYTTEDGYDRNKVVTFMEAKKELPVTTKEVVNEDSPEPKKESAPGDDINLDDVQF